jgi:hypothetical protein
VAVFYRYIRDRKGQIVVTVAIQIPKKGETGCIRYGVAVVEIKEKSSRISKKRGRQIAHGRLIASQDILDLMPDGAWSMNAFGVCDSEHIYMRTFLVDKVLGGCGKLPIEVTLNRFLDYLRANTPYLLEETPADGPIGIDSIVDRIGHGERTSAEESVVHPEPYPMPEERS